MSEILPCPYCESKDVVVCFVSFAEYSFVYCRECLADGKHVYGYAEAIAAWNEVAGMREKLSKVCQAAIDYDAAIRRHANKDSWINDSDELDDLYFKWLSAAREAKP